MEHQDWKEVTWVKSRSAKPTTKDLREGNVVSKLKTINKSTSNVIGSIKKLEKEEDTFIHPKVSLNMGKRIAQARNTKKITQKEFANAIYLPLKTIQEYESSKAIPNHLIINKMEKYLNCKLRD